MMGQQMSNFKRTCRKLGGPPRPSRKACSLARSRVEEMYSRAETTTPGPEPERVAEEQQGEADPCETFVEAYCK